MQKNAGKGINGQGKSPEKGITDIKMGNEAEFMRYVRQYFDDQAAEYIKFLQRSPYLKRSEVSVAKSQPKTSRPEYFIMSGERPQSSTVNDPTSNY